MKLALVISSLSFGGASRVMAALANAWVQAEHEVTLITLDTVANDGVALDQRVCRVALDLVQDSAKPLQAVGNNFRRVFALRKAIAISAAPVILSFEDRTNVIVVLATVGLDVRTVVCERTDPTRHDIGKVWPILRRVVYPLSSALVVQNDTLLPWARSVMFGRHRVHVIPNPVKESAAGRTGRNPTIAAVGRLVPEKAFDLLLRAFSDAARDFPEWKLVIVGDGPEHERLLTLINELQIHDRAHLAGWMSDPDEVLLSAGIFVMPSRYEGFPNALLEAMAAGLPLISTATAGSSELIRDGVNGLLVPTDSREKLAAALRQLMQDGGMRERLAANALKLSERYKLAAVLPRWDAALRGSSQTSTCAKIAFLIRALDIGGAQRQLVELAIGLHRAGWQVQVMTFYGGGEFEPQLRDAGVEIVCLDKQGRWDLLGFFSRMVRIVRRERPHIVHGYLEVPNIFIGCLRPLFAGARIVWGVRASKQELARFDLVGKIVFRLAVLCSRLADLVICNSESGRDYHADRGYDYDRMVVIPNGIDLTQFQPDARAREEVRAEWGIGAHEKLIGLVGRLDPMKGHTTFLQSAARVAMLRSDVKFICVGGGPAAYRSQLIDVADQLGLNERVIWAGARTDVARVYNALDLAISSSPFGEGTSNSIAEAMATGVPCVATAVGDSREIVGNLGWITASGDSVALADSIMEAISALPLDPGPIRRRIAAHFSSDTLIKRTADELCGLLEPHNRLRLDELT